MIYEYLTNFSKASLAIWLVALLVTTSFRYLLSPFIHKRSSFEPALLLAFFMACIQIGWEVLIGTMFSDHSLRELVGALWYLGFASSDWALIFLILWSVKKFSLSKCYCTDTILFAYAFMGIMQISRYCDRYILETDVLGFLYRNGIPAINSIITIVVIGQSVIICRGLLKSAKEVS
jgi:hypothetical protein